MKKKYDSPDFELIRVLLSNQLMIDSKPEGVGEGEGEQVPGEM